MGDIIHGKYPCSEQWNKFHLLWEEILLLTDLLTREIHKTKLENKKRSITYSAIFWNFQTSRCQMINASLRISPDCWILIVTWSGGTFHLNVTGEVFAQWNGWRKTAVKQELFQNIDKSRHTVLLSSSPLLVISDWAVIYVVLPPRTTAENFQLVSGGGPAGSVWLHGQDTLGHLGLHAAWLRSNYHSICTCQNLKITLSDPVIIV